jgi:hypothetical protein
MVTVCRYEVLFAVKAGTSGSRHERSTHRHPEGRSVRRMLTPVIAPAPPDSKHGWREPAACRRPPQSEDPQSLRHHAWKNRSDGGYRQGRRAGSVIRAAAGRSPCRSSSCAAGARRRLRALAGSCPSRRALGVLRCGRRQEQVLRCTPWAVPSQSRAGAGCSWHLGTRLRPRAQGDPCHRH